MIAEFAEDNFEDYEDDEAQGLEVRDQDREEQQKIKSKFAYLCRPPVDPHFYSEKLPLIFMQTDVDYYLFKGINKLL